MWGPITNPTARPLACWLGALWGRHEGARGGRLLPGCGASGVGRSPTPDHSSFAACGRGFLSTSCGCGGCGRADLSPTPQRALLRAGFARCEGGMRVPGGGGLLPGCGASGVGRSPTPDHSSFRACGRGPLATGCGCGGCGRGDPSPTQPRALLRAGCARCGGGMRVPGGGRLSPGCGASGVGRSATTDHSSFRTCGRGPLPTGCWCGGCGRGDLSPTPQRALLRAGFARCEGGTRAPGGGAPCLGVGRPGTGALPLPTSCPSGRAAGTRFSLAVGPVCGRGGPAVLGTFSRAAVRRVLCALPGFAAPVSRCGLVPVLVPWLPTAACLSGVPRGPALVRRASSGPVALGTLVSFSVA